MLPNRVKEAVKNMYDHEFSRGLGWKCKLMGVLIGVDRKEKRFKNWAPGHTNFNNSGHVKECGKGDWVGSG